MARRRLQKHGHLYKENGWWRLRWREDVVGDDGKVKRARPSTVIGRCKGPGALTYRKADRRAWDLVLSKVNQAELVPQSLMKLRDFVERRFNPEYVLALKAGGREHYGTQLAHLLVELGDLALRDVQHGQVQKMCLDLLQRTYTIGKDHVRKAGKDPLTGEQRFTIEKRARQAPYSVQAALHLKNATSAVFEYAKAVGVYSGENPARYVRLPEMQRKGKHALTWDQLDLLLKALPSPAREMANVAVLTSMNVAEICGLRWKNVNLSQEWATIDGEVIPPMVIAVRQQWSTRKGGGAYHTLKTRTRRRNLPIDSDLAGVLRRIASLGASVTPENPVFASSTGRPVDAHNLFNRVLKPIGTSLGMPWLGWHVFKHTHATLVRQEAMNPADQIAMLGHSDIRMTMHYGEQDLERRREIVERMGARLTRGKTTATAAPEALQ